MSLQFHVRQAATQRDWSIVFVVVMKKLGRCWPVIFRESNATAFRPRLKTLKSVSLVYSSATSLVTDL